MTKIELIKEMYNVIINNADVFNYPEKHMTEDYANNVKTTKKAELEKWLEKLNAMVEEAKKEETIETIETEAETVEVEKSVKDMTKAETVDTEYVVKPRATKKDIIMGLHKNDEVKCDLATAEAIAQEGFIYIREYEDGILYGEVEYDAVCEDIIDEDDWDLFDEVREGKIYHSDIDKAVEWYNAGFLKSIKYVGNGTWRCDMDWDGILTEFCNRWINNIYEAA